MTMSLTTPMLRVQVGDIPLTRTLGDIPSRNLTLGDIPRRPKLGMMRAVMRSSIPDVV
jgi:hypothetical protein